MNCFCMKLTALNLAVLAVIPAISVQAQESSATPSSQATTLDSIQVTARRRSESILDVPVAVSAFSEEQMKDLQANNIAGLQNAVPNINIVGSANTVNVFVRGIGQPDTLHTFDPGVGMYVDDVYYSRVNGALFSLFDIQQVEVLRGPQGTLYGKNSTGGAIKLTTKNPFDNPDGLAEITFGNYGLLEGRFYAAHTWGDRLAASLAGAKITNDGYVKDADTGKGYNDDDSESLRLKLVYDAAHNLRATLSLDTVRQDAALTIGRPLAELRQNSLAPAGIIALRPADTGRWNRRVRTSFQNGEGLYMRHSGGSLSLDWEINPHWTLKSITALRRLKTDSYVDIDGTEYELGDVLVAVNQHQRSQELQLHYDNGSNLHATFGAYYMKESTPSHQQAYADDLFSLLGNRIAFLRDINDDLDIASSAIFSHLNWEFIPTWTLAAGLRYSRDRKDYWRTTSTFWGAPFEALNETVAFTGRASWTAVTPSISLQKAFSDQLMGYVSANRGFKSGGFNGRANTVADTENARFDPEYVWTYELGMKGASANQRLRGSIAAFYSNYSDFQARVSQDVGTFPVLNAAKLNIKGAELEGSILLGEATTLSTQVGWMDARYERFDDFRLDPSWPGFDPNVNHNHVPFSPEWTARLALQHVFTLDGLGDVTLGGDIAWRAETWLTVDNWPDLRQDAYSIAGLFAVWDSPQLIWQVRAGVRNLTDREYRASGTEFSSVGNIQTAYYGLPRNWYLSLRYTF